MSAAHPTPDHRRIGRELELFAFSDCAPGQAFWQPRGVAVWNALMAAWRDLNASRGYAEVRTPLVYDASLWRTSGHWEKFRDEMFLCPSAGHERGLRPMNCPGHIELFRLRPRSHRELPLRLAEAGLVHRDERSGAVNGLLRTRAFVIDDAHIFCAPDQAAGEIAACLELARAVYRLFALEPRLELSTRPERRLGSDASWDAGEHALAAALEAAGLPFAVRPGEGAFYGPKIDLHVADSLGRSWQLGTIQVDQVMPERFGIEYAGADGRAARPVIVHRAVLGSLERFLAVLLEHLDGRLPGWLAPVQAVVLPVADRHAAVAADAVAALARAGVRAELDGRGGPLAGRIRAVRPLRAPHLVVVGDAERDAGELAVRDRDGGRWSAPVARAVERIAGACRRPAA